MTPENERHGLLISRAKLGLDGRGSGRLLKRRGGGGDWDNLLLGLQRMWGGMEDLLVLVVVRVGRGGNGGLLFLMRGDGDRRLLFFFGDENGEQVIMVSCFLLVLHFLQR